MAVGSVPRTSAPAATARRSDPSPVTLPVTSAGTSTAAAAVRSPERVVLRLLGALEAARIEAPRLAVALRTLGARATTAADPLSPLPARLRSLVRKVTMPAAREKGQWEMRESLLAPPPFSATWRQAWPKGSHLVFETARAPGATYVVEVAGRVVWRRDGGQQRTPFAEHEVPLDAHVRAGEEAALTLRTLGRGIAYFGAPRVLARTGDGMPSVILIAVDTLTAEAVGFAGSKRKLSPRMDALAASGAAMPQAITNANWTRASTLSMFASEYSTTLGINVHSWWLDRQKRSQLYQRHEGMLPELLKRAGYETAAIVNNLFVLGYHGAGVEVGFEHVTDFRTDHRDTPDVTAATLEYLKKRKDRPFFLFMNLNTPHHPYTPPPRYLAGVERPGERLHPEHKRYLGEVKFADDYVGRVLAALDAHGMRERTLVILTADHGEGLRADLAYTNVAIGRFSRFTHTVNMYDEVVRVPLAISRPADIPRGQVIQEQVRLLDLAPTVLGLVGLPQHPQHRGVDLSAALRGRGQVPSDLPAFVEGKKISSLRWKGYKYIHREPGFERLARRRDNGAVTRVPEELYAVGHGDPRELRDLTASKPSVLAELRAAHRAWRAQMARGVLPKGRALTAVSPSPSEATPSAAPSPSVSPPVPEVARATPSTRALPKKPATTELLLTSDAQPRHVKGRLVARAGRIVRYRLRNSGLDDALWLSSPTTLDFELRADGGEDRLSVHTEPPDAELSLEVTVDARALPAEKLWVGPFGLPLLSAPFVVRRDQHLWLASAEAPPRRRGEFGLLLWREGSGRLPAGTLASPPGQQGVAAEPAHDGASGGEALEADVENALRGWGYIQAGDKVLK